MVIVNAKEFLSFSGKSIEIPYLCELKGKNQDGITVEQKKYLHKLGIGWSQLRYKGQAQIVLDVAIERLEKHLATPGQMRKLADMGVSIVHKRTFKEAKYILNGGSPDAYKGLLITIIYDHGTNKQCKLTARSRRDAKQKYQMLLANKATNIHFNVQEPEE